MNLAKPCGCTHIYTHSDILLIEDKETKTIAGTADSFINDRKIIRAEKFAQ